MKKLLKYTKLFMMGLLAVTLSLSTVGCIEDEEPEIYQVTVNVTGGTGAGASVDGDDYRTTTFAEVGERVDIRAGTGTAGRVFSHWTATPAVTFNSSTSSNTWFTMPGNDVTITAVFVEPDIFYDGEAQIRFTWRTADQGNIIRINTSWYDVEKYYEDWYSDPNYHVTNTVMGEIIQNIYGSQMLPDKFFGIWSAEEGLVGQANKGKYFDIEPGIYVAVLEGVDDYSYFDIIANYVIEIEPASATADGRDFFFELGFEVGEFVDDAEDGCEAYGQDEDCWGFWRDLNSTTTPRFQKRQTVNGATMDVTYYVIRRQTKREL